MANVTYNEGKKIILTGGVPLANLKVMLVKSTYAANPDTLALDDGTANDPASHELTVAGYARQALASAAIGKDDSGDFAYVDADDTAFGALAIGETIGGILVFRDTGGVDTARVPLMFFDTPDTPTNGAAITVQWAAVVAGAVLKLAGA